MIDATVNVSLTLDTSAAIANLDALSVKLNELQARASSLAVGGGGGGGGAPRPGGPAPSPAPQQFNNNLKNANAGLETTKTELAGLNAQFKELSSTVRTASAEMKRSGKRSGTTQQDKQKSPMAQAFGSDPKGQRATLTSRVGSVAMYAVASRIVMGAMQSIAASFQTMTGVDDEIKQLNKVLTTSDKILKGLKTTATETGKEFGSSIKDVLQGYKVFAQQGLQPTEVAKRGRAVTLATNVTTMSTNQAAEAITAGLKVFNSDLNNSAESMIDSFLAVESQNAVTAGELADVMQRIGSAAAAAGTSFHELSAMTTVIKERTRAPSSTISRALKFVFRNISRAPVEATLAQLDIATTDTSGDLRNTFDVLKDLSKVYPTLTKRQKQNIAVQIGGTRFIPHFMALMDDFGKTGSIVTQSQQSSGVAMERNAIIMQSFSKQVEKTKTSFQGLGVSIGDGLLDPLSSALSVVRLIVDGITKVSNMKLPFSEYAQGAAGVAPSEQTGISAGDIGGTALAAGSIAGIIRLVQKKAVIKGAVVGALSKIPGINKLIGTAITTGTAVEATALTSTAAATTSTTAAKVATAVAAKQFVPAMAGGVMLGAGGVGIPLAAREAQKQIALAGFRPGKILPESVKLAAAGGAGAGTGAVGVQAAKAGGIGAGIGAMFTKLKGGLKGIPTQLGKLKGSFMVLVLAVAAVLKVIGRLTESGEDTAQRLGLNTKRKEAQDISSRNTEIKNRLDNIKTLRGQVTKSGIKEANQEEAVSKGQIIKTTKELSGDFSKASDDLRKLIVETGVASQIKEIKVNGVNDVVFTKTGKNALATEDSAAQVSNLVARAQAQKISDVTLKKSMLNFSKSYETLTGENPDIKTLASAAEKMSNLTSIGQGATKQNFFKGTAVSKETFDVKTYRKTGEGIGNNLAQGLYETLAVAPRVVAGLGTAGLSEMAGFNPETFISRTIEKQQGTVEGLSDKEYDLLVRDKKALDSALKQSASSMSGGIEQELLSGLDFSQIAKKQTKELNLNNLGGGGLQGVIKEFQDADKESTKLVAGVKTLWKAWSEGLKNSLSGLGLMEFDADKYKDFMQQRIVGMDQKSRKSIGKLDPRKTPQKFFETLNKIIQSQAMGDLQAQTVNVAAKTFKSEDDLISKAAAGDIIKINTKSGKEIEGLVQKGMDGVVRVFTRDVTGVRGKDLTDKQKVDSLKSKDLKDLSSKYGTNNIQLFSMNRLLQNLTSIAAQSLRTGFGAGQAIGGVDFKLGADDLLGLKDQTAGTFKGFSEEGLPTFNKGLKQFLITAAAQQAENKKNLEGFKTQASTTLEKGSPSEKNFLKAIKQEEASGLIARAVTGFGKVIKTFQQAVNMFSKNAARQRAAAEIPITTVGPLSKTGLGDMPSVMLGKLEKDLTPMERAFSKMPDTFKQLSNMQLALKSMREVRTEDLSQLTSIKNLVGQASQDTIKDINLDVVKDIFQRYGEGVPGKKIDSLVTDLISGDNKDSAAAREELFNILTQSIDKVGNSSIEYSDKLRAAAEPLERSIMVAKSLSQLATTAMQASRALQDIEAVGNTFDNLASAAGEGPRGLLGEKAPTVYSTDRRSGPEFSQPLDFSGLNQHQLDRRMIEMRSSPDVQRGSRRLFDENYERITPLNDKQREEELAKLRVREQKTNKQETRKVTNTQLSTQKSLAENLLKGVNRVLTDQPNLSAGTKSGLEGIKRDLKAFGNIDPRSFVTGSGELNKDAFKPLDKMQGRFDQLIGYEGKRLTALAQKDPSLMTTEMRKVLLGSGNISGELRETLTKQQQKADASPITTAIASQNPMLASIEHNTAVMAGNKGITSAGVDKSTAEKTSPEAMELKRKDPVAYYKKYFSLLPQLAENAKKKPAEDAKTPTTNKSAATTSRDLPTGKILTDLSSEVLGKAIITGVDKNGDFTYRDQQVDTKKRDTALKKYTVTGEKDGQLTYGPKPFKADEDPTKTSPEAMKLKKEDPVAYYKKFFSLLPELAENAKAFAKPKVVEDRKNFVDLKGEVADKFGFPAKKQQVLPATKQPPQSTATGEENLWELPLEEALNKVVSPNPLGLGKAGQFTRYNDLSGFGTSGLGKPLPKEREFLKAKALPQGMTLGGSQRLELAEDYGEEVISAKPDKVITAPSTSSTSLSNLYKGPQPITEQVPNKSNITLSNLKKDDKFPRREWQNTLQQANARNPQQNQIVGHLDRLNTTNTNQLKQYSKDSESNKERVVKVEASDVRDAMSVGAREIKSALTAGGTVIAVAISNAVTTALKNSGNENKGNKSSATETELKSTLTQFVDTQRNEMLQQLNRIEAVEGKLNLVDNRTTYLEKDNNDHKSNIGNITTVANKTLQTVEEVENRLHVVQGNMYTA